mgnify:CR=1 FL=1
MSPIKYSVSIQMRGSAHATPAVHILANGPEDAWVVAQMLVRTIWDAAVRPEGAEFSATVCSPVTYELSHFANFESDDPK